MQPNNSEANFNQYDAENPGIYEAFKKFTFKAIDRHYKNYSAEFIFNVIRWETNSKADGDYKINNNFKPFYARKFMNDFPDYDGLFRTRKSKADAAQ